MDPLDPDALQDLAMQQDIEELDALYQALQQSLNDLREAMWALAQAEDWPREQPLQA